MKVHDSTAIQFIALIATGLLLPLACLSASGRTVHEVRQAAANGTVEIENVSGSIHVEGVDSNSVDVSGSIGNKVERVEVTQAGERTTVRVVLPAITMNSRNESDANLTVKVPKGSAIDANLVSSDLHLRGITGSLQLRTVSGDVDGSTAGDSSIATVSGDVKLENGAGRNLRIKTTSGDVRIHGGLGSADIDSVSGDVRLELGSAPNAHVSIQTLSGDIETCGAANPVESRRGPGSRLHFDSGTGGGHVHINTTSGDVRWCVAGAATKTL
jgi:hypothetical protein